MFYKETTDVIIEADDVHNGSGVAKVEYLKSETVFETVDDISGQWTVMDRTQDGEYKFSILPNEKVYIYVRVTDNAGNVTVINAEGIVVYTDAKQSTERIDFWKSSEKDVAFSVKLNGNTIDAIYIDQTELSKEYYSISEDGATVTIDASYLQKMEVGTYEIRVTYKPMGETYEDGAGNEVPNATTVELTIAKKDVIPQTGDNSIFYAGLMIFALVDIVVVMVLRRKRNTIVSRNFE